MGKIILTNIHGGLVVDTCDIVCCEAQDCYSLFHFTDGRKKIVCRTLKGFEEELCGNSFVRIHRKYIINMDHVRYFDRKKSNRVLLTNDMIIGISFRKKKEFLAKFLQHISGNK